MHLSNESSAYFVRTDSSNILRVGWRVHVNLSPFTHITLLTININPYKHPKSRFSKIYCNLVEKTITDPFGTILIIGGTNYNASSEGNYQHVCLFISIILNSELFA